MTQQPNTPTNKLTKINTDLGVRVNLLLTKQSEVDFLLTDIQRLLKEQKELLSYGASNTSGEESRSTKDSFTNYLVSGLKPTPVTEKFKEQLAVSPGAEAFFKTESL